MLMAHNSFILLIFAEAFTFLGLGRCPPVLQLFAYDIITIHVAF